MPLPSGLSPPAMVTCAIRPYFQIPGISAASGILYHDRTLYLIADNSQYLYVFDPATDRCSTVPLAADPAEHIPKPAKPDVESLTLYKNRIYAFGSGSKPNRCLLYIYDLRSGSVVTEDLSARYESLQRSASVPASEFNIEGAVFRDGHWLFFQRGNGAGGCNGVFISRNEPGNAVRFVPVHLPDIDGFAASFTDATTVGDAIFFLASAEDTKSTYEDGTIIGSIFGRMNPENYHVEDVMMIPGRHKFEGLTFYRQTETALEFLVCEDSDSDEKTATIYLMTVPRALSYNP
ncbi:hypothetical protein HYN48_07805 [Flavobacterium magnum]|uniref:Uncharacterized protein n=1 Tax=Flavobacterium magnum TaxID=2162713 RepID=A0A2S0RE80_9FLAO|nr:hypothetical protein [Flavobacterium magnum]AWA29986.1 hypothetical protein HYN48_07805 [Flavobacterium magnum]